MQNQIQHNHANNSLTELTKLSISNPAEVVNLNSPSMSLIKKEHGEIIAFRIIVGLIDAVNDYFNTARPMSGPQIMETARLIMADYFYYKPAEFKLCFDNGKRGMYGKVYDRIDGGILYEWLRQYDAERTAAMENHRIREKSLIQRTEPVINYDELKKMAETNFQKRKTETERPKSAGFGAWLENIRSIWPELSTDERSSILADIASKNVNGVFDAEIEQFKKML